MNIQDIHTVVVVGAGAMGRQIAMNTALKGRSFGYQVINCDAYQGALDNAKAWAADYLVGRVKKGRVTQEEADQVAAALTFSTDVEGSAAKADLVIEAVIEDLQVKRDLFAKLSNVCREDTILATNSSDICSSKLAKVVKNPARLMNMHFFNPALVMQLTELVRGPKTSEETIETAKAFCVNTGKSPIVLKKEIAGFVANRINAAVTHEACSLLEKGIASIEDIDTACEKGLGYPMGPFKLMDMTGLDVNYYVRRDRYAQSGDPNDMPSFCVVDKVIKGELGRKTGKGWYEYPQNK